MNKRELKLTYHNDGKGKLRSHEVESPYLDDHFGHFIYGDGDSPEKAYENFVEVLDDYIKDLQTFRMTLDLNEATDVDGMGNPRKENK